MSAQRLWMIDCDHLSCTRHEEIDGRGTLKEARHVLSLVGWASACGRDWCPWHLTEAQNFIRSRERPSPRPVDEENERSEGND